MPTSERQADARAAFAQWAATQPACPGNAASLVERVDGSEQHVGLMNTDVQGRRVVWKSVGYSGRARVTFPSVSIETVDAWNVDAASLRERSDHVAICDSCAGAGRNTCNTCAGAGNLACGDCRGERKRYGYAADGSRRLLNCQSCRGKGAVDCPDCRRGVGSCAACDGNGRLQRWIELQWWKRSIGSAHPDALARQFGWDLNPMNEVMARDADIVIDVQRPHRLTAADIGAVPPQWLTELEPRLDSGERVTDQRLRIARVSTHTVEYRLGSECDRVAFTGRRLVPPAALPTSAFARRASFLRGVRWLLLLILGLIAFISFARGSYYWTTPTLLSLGATTAALACVYGGVAEWTAARRRMHQWMLAAATCAVVAIVLALTAMPRLNRAVELIAAGNLDGGERELVALRGDVPAAAWADLRLARIRRTTDTDVARAALTNIPRNLPQYAQAADAAGRLLVRDAAAHVRAGRWNEAAETIITARSFGAAESQLAPVLETIREAGLDQASAAGRVRDAPTRLQQRVAAEAILVAWERASGDWGTHPLIALRTSMAHDVATIERAGRRRRP